MQPKLAKHMDKIFICDLKINPIIGLYPRERIHRQGLLLNVEIGLDLQAASYSDNLLDTVNYAEIEERIITLADNSKYLLIERLAGAIGRLVLEYPLVQSVKVRIEKPRAARYARAIAVELNFTRDSVKNNPQNQNPADQ